MPRKYNKTAKLCGAKRRGTDLTCKKPAGWGTDHNGRGKCKYHGGATPSGPDSANFKHGGYADVFLNDFKAHYDAVADNDTPFELLPEFNAQRAMYRAYVQKVTEQEDGASFEQMGNSIQLADTVINAASKIIKARNDSALTIAEIEFIQAGLRTGIEKYVDADKREDFINHIGSYFPNWSDAGGE